MKKIIASGLMSVAIVGAIGMGVYAVPAAPPDGNGGGAPGMSNNSSVSYNGAYTISSDTSLEGTSFSSTTGAENALLITGGTVKLDDIKVTKSGDDSGDNSDFYGTNAAILATGGTVEIEDSEVTTDGAHANGIFAIGEGKITVKDTKIRTTADNSGGIMVTGGGTLVAEDLDVETSGNSSAAIRSDRGGGTMTVEGGTYKANGTGSPTIYSTADITVKDAELTSTASEGVVIEGSNSVTLEDVTMEDTNVKLNGNSETYKNIFIYQSMSGDASEGTGTFTAKNSKIITNKGEHFFITNTTAVINLENNSFTNNDESGIFLKANSAKWGNSGSNGGQVNLNLTNEEIVGDMAIDEISSVKMTLSSGSYYKGALTGDNYAVAISDDVSVLVLAADTNLTALENADADNLNIYANGHKLYVNGEEVSINQGTPPEHKVGYTELDEDDNIEEEDENEKNHVLLWILGGTGVIVGLALIITIVTMMQKKQKSGKIEEVYGDTKTES